MNEFLMRHVFQGVPRDPVVHECSNTRLKPVLPIFFFFCLGLNLTQSRLVPGRILNKLGASVSSLTVSNFFFVQLFL